MSVWHHGVVTNVRDPESKGRVRLRVPQLLGPVETGWVDPMFPAVSVRAGDKVFVVAEAENLLRLLYAATSEVIRSPILQAQVTVRGRSLAAGAVSASLPASGALSGSATISGAAAVYESYWADGTLSGSSSAAGSVGVVHATSGSTSGTSSVSASATIPSHWTAWVSATTDAAP